MKTLLLLRHAKSRRDIEGLTDFERPLSDRGRSDIVLTGNEIVKRKLTPGLIISSPANRAITTARLLSELTGYPRKGILIEESIYDGWKEDILHIITRIDDEYDTAMIVGHNPELQTLAHNLCGFDEENLPTCGLVGMSFETTSWAKTANMRAQQILYDYPKKHY